MRGTPRSPCKDDKVPTGYARITADCDRRRRARGKNGSSPTQELILQRTNAVPVQRRFEGGRDLLQEILVNARLHCSRKTTHRNVEAALRVCQVCEDHGGTATHAASAVHHDRTHRDSRLDEAAELPDPGCKG